MVVAGLIVLMLGLAVCIWTPFALSSDKSRQEEEKE